MLFNFVNYSVPNYFHIYHLLKSDFIRFMGQWWTTCEWQFKTVAVKLISVLTNTGKMNVVRQPFINQTLSSLSGQQIALLSMAVKIHIYSVIFHTRPARQGILHEINTSCNRISSSGPSNCFSRVQTGWEGGFSEMYHQASTIWCIHHLATSGIMIIQVVVWIILSRKTSSFCTEMFGLKSWEGSERILGLALVNSYSHCIFLVEMYHFLN